MEKQKVEHSELVIVGSRFCRRTRKIVNWLRQEGIPFEYIDIESSEGRKIATEYRLRAAPGIIRRGKALNPFDLLHQCRVHPNAARKLILGDEQ